MIIAPDGPISASAQSTSRRRALTTSAS
jgi:hypothetical protein